jgi:hypothetical protein
LGGFPKKATFPAAIDARAKDKKTLNIKPVSTPLAARLYGENTQSIELSAKWYLLAEKKARFDMKKKIPKKTNKTKTKQMRDDRHDLFLDPHAFGTFRPPCRPPLPYPGRIPRLTSLHTSFLSISIHHPRTTRKPE